MTEQSSIELHLAPTETSNWDLDANFFYGTKKEGDEEVKLKGQKMLQKYPGFDQILGRHVLISSFLQPFMRGSDQYVSCDLSKGI